jgi:hypothetical protein
MFQDKKEGAYYTSIFYNHSSRHVVGELRPMIELNHSGRHPGLYQSFTR